jgi:hypothetical protein
MVTLALFWFLILFSQQFSKPLSNPEPTDECWADPSQAPKSKDKDHVKQIRFFDNEDKSDFNDSFTKTKKP